MSERERLDISTEHCTVEGDGAVLVVTMNRPEAKNSLSSAMLVGLADAWALLDESDDLSLRGPHRCRWVVLLGHGPQGSVGESVRRSLEG